MLSKLKKFIKNSTTGFVSGGADNDPAGIATYSIAGATTGYSQLWLMVLAAPMLIAVQSMCARIGDVKRKGLAAIIKEHYSYKIALTGAAILVICNVITIGADLAGMSAALSLIIPINYVIWIIPVAILIWYIVLFNNYKAIERILLVLVLVYLSYVFSAILSKPDWIKIFQEIVLPQFNLTPAYLASAVGIMGTTITPYLFFWQTKEEVEEKKPLPETLVEAKNEEKILAPGFIFSQAVTIFIMISSATVLFGNREIKTAADAALALEPLAGGLAKYLFAIGIIGSGLLAIPVLSASTAYVVAETFNWRDSLSDKINKAKGFYFVITLSLLVGIVIAGFNINPIKSLFYSQILAGMSGPILIVLIIKIANDKKIMGQFTNNLFDNFFSLLSVIIMVLSSLFLVWNLIWTR